MKTALDLALGLRFRLRWEHAKTPTAVTAILLAHVDAQIALLESELALALELAA